MNGKLAVFVACLALACGEPLAVFPGGELQGDLRPAGAAFSAADGFGTAQLETRPEAPRERT